jgi:hypothetical protein
MNTLRKRLRSTLLLTGLLTTSYLAFANFQHNSEYSTDPFHYIGASHVNGTTYAYFQEQYPHWIEAVSMGRLRSNGSWDTIYNNVVYSNGTGTWWQWGVSTYDWGISYINDGTAWGQGSRGDVWDF